MKIRKALMSVLLTVLLFTVQAPTTIEAYDIDYNQEVLLGGQTVGIAMYLNGLYVTNTVEIKNSEGKYVIPAAKAGIKKGDYILKANDIELNDISNLDAILNASKGEKIRITAERNNKVFYTDIEPVFSEGSYRLGLWLRESIAGLGTVTYIDKDNGAFAALGHSISEGNNVPLKIKDGRILACTVTGVKKGKKGEPGELIGTFGVNAEQIGKINDNTTFGLKGTECKIKSGTIKIADKETVQTGKAYIYSDFETGKTEKYEIEILYIYGYDKPSEKSMIIKVTDSQLLEKTGGIVQGMSGSPIVQDGKLIGAVTHVMLSDSSRGYGIFIENMIENAQTLSDSGKLKDVS